MSDVSKNPGYTPSTELLKRRLLRDGSLALHIEHNWERTEDWGDGIWCVDCEVWVVPPSK